MLTASDGHAYVVKFTNNPQSVRVLANEWLGSSIGRALGLTIPEPAILYVPAELVESSPSLVIRLSSSTLKCSHGLAFGSRVISGDEVFDYLPDSVFARIENRHEFVGTFALDKWLCNCDEEKPTGTSVLTLLTSATASTPKNGLSRTRQHAGSMPAGASTRTYADGSRLSPG